DPPKRRPGALDARPVVVELRNLGLVEHSGNTLQPGPDGDHGGPTVCRRLVEEPGPDRPLQHPVPQPLHLSTAVEGDRLELAALVAVVDHVVVGALAVVEVDA